MPISAAPSSVQPRLRDGAAAVPAGATGVITRATGACVAIVGAPNGLTAVGSAGVGAEAVLRAVGGGGGTSVGRDVRVALATGEGARRGVAVGPENGRVGGTVDRRVAVGCAGPAVGDEAIVADGPAVGVSVAVAGVSVGAGVGMIEDNRVADGDATLVEVEVG